MLDGLVLLPVGVTVRETGWTVLGLWLAVGASGLYHGMNPGMGWPLAVSAGLMERSSRAVFNAIGYLAVGHLLGMLAAILPFALLATLATVDRELRIVASLALIVFGAGQLLWRRHPRFLTRIPPSRLGLWSFAVAIAHGAGLMLVPIYLGLCRSDTSDSGHAAAAALGEADLGIAVLVSLVHTGAMLLAGGGMAWMVYRYFGLALISRSWFNLEAAWAVSLIAVGLLSLSVAMASP